MKAMRGLIALQKHFVRNSHKILFRFAELWECARVLASLFGTVTGLQGYQ